MSNDLRNQVTVGIKVVLNRNMKISSKHTAYNSVNIRPMIFNVAIAFKPNNYRRRKNPCKLTFIKGKKFMHTGVEDLKLRADTNPSLSRRSKDFNP